MEDGSISPELIH